MTQGVFTLQITALDWQYTSHEVFNCVANQPWAMLLDSASSEHIDANIDVIVAAPIATLTSKANELTFNVLNDEALVKRGVTAQNVSQIVSASKTPLECLKGLHHSLYSNLSIKSESRFSFVIGAMGAFSYDLGRSIEVLPVKAMQDISFDELTIGFYDESLIYCHHQKKWFHCQLVCQSDTAQTSTLRSLFETKQPTPSVKPFSLIDDWQTQISKKEYLSKFDKVQAYLKSGDCYQINLTQRFEANYQGDEWQAYKTLCEHNQAPFSAYLHLPKHKVLSLSPERFIKLSDHHIETKPIKGTLPRLADPALDKEQKHKLKQSEKDRAENVMIVDLLRNDLGKVATPGSVNVPKLFDVESFPAVHHLVSTVCAQLQPELTACDVLTAAFPGGSITGAPKIRAMEIIEELEPSRRSIYCGSIGYINYNGDMDTSITIRTLITQMTESNQNKIYCWAGGGIVADSDAEAEYQESFDKVAKILPILETKTSA